MGLFNALRRWWTMEGEPRCFLCSRGVRRRDIERGKALVLGRQPYCRKCVKLFTEKRSTGGALADSSHAAPA